MKHLQTIKPYCFSLLLVPLDSKSKLCSSSNRSSICIFVALFAFLVGGVLFFFSSLGIWGFDASNALVNKEPKG
jgi:hypothetical protein